MKYLENFKESGLKRVVAFQDEFDNKWGEYRTGGDINLTELYAKI